MIEDESINLKREELYEMVWSEPMTKLSKKFGLSDNGLRKICKKHNIPLPKAGHWTKKAVGYSVKKVPLPNPSSDKNIEIRPNPSNKLTSGVDPSISQQVEAVQNFPPIIVAKSLRTPHPLVSRSLDILELCQPNDAGILEPTDKKCLNIRVSDKSLRRALRIMDALIKGLLEQGHEISQTDGSARVQIGEEWLAIGISEEVISQKTQPESTNLEGDYQFNHSRFDYVRVPSGNLCLSIDELGYYGNYNLRKNWRDTKRKQLEDSLDAFVVGLVKISVQKKEYRRQKKKEERQRQEIARQRQEHKQQLLELKRKIKQEQARIDKLITDAENHSKSKQIRDLITAVENERIKGSSIYVSDENYDEWIKWARDQADRLDPLSLSPASILDEVVEEDIDDRNKW